MDLFVAGAFHKMVACIVFSQNFASDRSWYSLIDYHNFIRLQLVEATDCLVTRPQERYNRRRSLQNEDGSCTFGVALFVHQLAYRFFLEFSHWHCETIGFTRISIKLSPVLTFEVRNTFEAVKDQSLCQLKITFQWS